MGLIDSLAKRVPNRGQLSSGFVKLGFFKKWIRVEELWSRIGDRG